VLFFGIVVACVFSMTIQTDLNLKTTFDLIQEIKKGIKQKCYVTITETSIGVSEVGLRIIIQTKNYRTKENMHVERTIPEINLIHADREPHYTIIKKLIDEANKYFKKEQINAVNEHSFFNKNGSFKNELYN